MKSKSLFWLITIWTCSILLSLFWNYNFTKRDTHDIVLNKARSFFEQIVVTRSWNASHGGIYVIQDEGNPSNPYLKDSLRDIVATNGLRLTMINPAYMTRQISEINRTNDNLQFHITSLNPIRKENKADEWETKALSNFNSTNTEVLEHIETDSTSQYRYMAPIYTEQSCLKCHAFQGYKVGDIRGGISISFPSKIFTLSEKRQIFTLITIHLLLLLLGIFGILKYFSMTKKYFTELNTKNIALIEKEKQLILSNEQLSKVVAKKNKFFSIISHDLKNPFNVLIGYSDLIINEKETISKNKLDNYLTVINETTKKSYQLLENLLEWSLSETDSIAYNPTQIDLNLLIRNGIEWIREPAKKKQIKVTINTPEKAIAKADRNMIETVIRNLLSNAIKYSNIGGNIDVSIEENNDSITVSIKDYGVGMNAQQIENLFSINSIKTTPGTQEEKGTGLGLILCKEFIERHHGKIWVISEPNKGSNFKFSLFKN